MATSDDRQVHPDGVDDVERCQAIAVDTSEQCEHDALPGSPYCWQHSDPEDFDITD